MVAAEESQTRQQFSAWNPTDSNHMSLQLEQNCSLPSFAPSTLTANLAFPGQPNFGLLGSNTGQPNAVARVLQAQHPFGIPCLKNSPQHGLGCSDKPTDVSRKRFLIFDRSGNWTRLFVSPSFSRQNSSIASSKVPATSSVSGVDQQLLVKPVVEEKWGENNLNDEEGEMLEDAEEINALPYSDSDDDSHNDEVSSTRHTIEGCGNKGESHEEVMEEVASSDGSPKRRKLLDGTRCGGARTSYDGAGSSENEEKVRVHEAVKMLGSIIPGLKSKDPLSIIEKAIVYLERMKMEATFPY